MTNKCLKKFVHKNISKNKFTCQKIIQILQACSTDSHFPILLATKKVFGRKDKFQDWYLSTNRRFIQKGRRVISIRRIWRQATNPITLCRDSPMCDSACTKSISVWARLSRKKDSSRWRYAYETPTKCRWFDKGGVGGFM